MQDHTQADRLYVVTRADLPDLGLSAAQATHAAFEFAARYPLITTRWMQESNFIVLVTAPDEASLRGLHRQALVAGLRATSNYEPDLDDTLTAIVIEPSAAAKRICRDLPLLGAVPVAG